MASIEEKIKSLLDQAIEGIESVLKDPIDGTSAFLDGSELLLEKFTFENSTNLS